MKTSRGIYLNIDESIYYYEYKNLKFYFSSKFNLKRFSEKVDEFVKKETYNLQIKFQNPVYIDEFLAIVFYRKIERRGFRIQEAISDKRIKNAIIKCNVLKVGE